MLVASSATPLLQESAGACSLQGAPHAGLGLWHLALEGQEALQEALSNNSFLRVHCELQEKGIGKEMLHAWALDQLRKRKQIENEKAQENS